MSEKSTRKAPDYAVESRAAPNRSLFSTANAVLVLKTHQERYNSSESGLKKEIPVYISRSQPKPCAPPFLDLRGTH
jgi:hypothetical protein